jgi:hypothetical protein
MPSRRAYLTSQVECSRHSVQTTRASHCTRRAVCRYSIYTVIALLLSSRSSVTEATTIALWPSVSDYCSAVCVPVRCRHHCLCSLCAEPAAVCCRLQWALLLLLLVLLLVRLTWPLLRCCWCCLHHSMHSVYIHGICSIRAQVSDYACVEQAWAYCNYRTNRANEHCMLQQQKSSTDVLQCVACR